MSRRLHKAEQLYMEENIDPTLDQALRNYIRKLKKKLEEA